MIDSIALFIEDLLGCTEEDTECKAKARKYATWLILISILALILFFAPKLYRWYKPKVK